MTEVVISPDSGDDEFRVQTEEPGPGEPGEVVVIVGGNVA